MKALYEVHSATPQGFEVEALVGSTKVQATVMGMVVELISLDKTMTIKRVVMPQDMEAAQEIYVVGTVVASQESVLTDPADIAAAAPVVAANEARLAQEAIDRAAELEALQAADAAMAAEEAAKTAEPAPDPAP